MRAAKQHSACLCFCVVALLIRDVGAVGLRTFETHQTLPRGDEETAVVSLATPFVFLQRNYTEISVSFAACTVCDPHFSCVDRQSLRLAVAVVLHYYYGVRYICKYTIIHLACFNTQ